MKKKHLIILALIWLMCGWCITQSYAQQENTPYIKYQMKFEGIETRAQAKGVWDNIRFYFNKPETPFLYRLDFTDLYYFEIVVPYDKSDVEIREYFESKNMILIEYNKYYYE